MHLISMDAQKMDTNFWRFRLDTHRSSVSVFTDNLLSFIFIDPHLKIIDLVLCVVVGEKKRLISV